MVFKKQYLLLQCIYTSILYIQVYTVYILLKTFAVYIFYRQTNYVTQ